jgi:crotonobetainyl-CoA:carnitine CoA-transferase CaiB-like acyl-CoA transferase
MHLDDKRSKTVYPLSGIRILDLTRLLPGGYCTLFLADMGAEVIKVEDTERGDYLRWSAPFIYQQQSASFFALNRNKKSIKLNLKTAKGVEIFRKLTQTSDVIVEGFRPGVVDRLGVGYNAVKKVKEDIIYCSITGYGQDGPYSSKVGHDINYIAYAGILGLNGLYGGRPAIPPVQIADIAGGGLNAVIGILLALLYREKTGKGQYIDVSMTDGVISWLSIHAAKFFADSIVPRQEGMRLSGAYPCYNVYETKEGKYVSLGALEPKFWEQFLQVIHREDLRSGQFATGDEGEKVKAELRQVFREKTQAEWIQLLGGQEICFAPVYAMNEVFNDPQVRHRKMVFESMYTPVDAEGKPGQPIPVKQLAFPIKLSEITEHRKESASGHGEHTEELLKGIGYSAEEIIVFRAEGII